jgi:hypothetical protein
MPCDKRLPRRARGVLIESGPGRRSQNDGGRHSQNKISARSVRRSTSLAGAFVLVAFLLATFRGHTTATAQDEKAPSENVARQDSGLAIEPADLPGTYPHAPYQVVFHARGNYVPTLHWKVESGTLPPGMKLDDNGILHGQAERAGEFQFVLAVRDSGKPQQAVQRTFTIKVVEALAIAWKVPPHVNVKRIEGSVEVSNATPEDMDLTFDVKAVADNGRATEIGYQHFPLRKGTVGMVLPFGDTLPNGGYMVYVTVVGEVVPRKVIYRELLQTPSALQVNVGP